MRQLKILLICFLISMSLITCKKSIVETDDESGGFVDVQIDLQSGFEDNWIQIKINGIKTFEAILSPIVFLAGPMASYTTNIPRGMNRLGVSWVPMADAIIPSPPREKNCDFQIGIAERYYIGLSIANDSLSIIVQDEPFLYL